MARDLNLKNVHFCPELAPERMPAVYRSGDVLVFPTIEDVWGLVVNEAILSGIPVLCSKYAGCARELLPTENIFDPRNQEEFKEKLRAAIAGQIARPDPSRLRTTPSACKRPDSSPRIIRTRFLREAARKIKRTGANSNRKSHSHENMSSA